MIVTYLLTGLHVVVALFLIAVVLLQTGKRADLAGAFGGGGSQTAFGTRGAATLLSKATTASAVIFMLTSLALSILASRGSADGGSVLPADAEPPAQTQTAPIQPVPQDPQQQPPSQELPPPASDAPSDEATPSPSPDPATPSGPG
jgi:preprotein translocase subunit SecG